jgi:spore coat polysaccharide biosynthesis protein SpsF
MNIPGGSILLGPAKGQNAMKTCVLLAARMGSSRFPGKTLAPMGGKPMVERMIDRVRRARHVDGVMIATTDRAEDDQLEAFAGSIGAGCHRGSADDVLGRITGAAKAADADRIIELLGDNPLVHARLIDDVVDFFDEGQYDYAATVTNEYPHADPEVRRFPIGIRVQVLPRSTLERCEQLATEARHREHSTDYIYENPDVFRLGYFQATGSWAALNRPELTFAVNLPENLKMLNALLDYCGENADPTLQQVVEAFDALPAVHRLMGNDAASKK